LQKTIPKASQLFDRIEYELESVGDHRVRELIVGTFVTMLKEIRKTLIAAQGLQAIAPMDFT
jgi:hypothetical protein